MFKMISNCPNCGAPEPKNEMDKNEILTRIDPGTGLSLEQLIDAFISNPRERKNIKEYIIQLEENK